MSDQNPDDFDDDFLLDDEQEETPGGYYDEPADDTDLDYIDDDFMDDGWDEGLYDEPDEDLIQGEKKSWDFNKMAITGAVIAGFFVLAYQVYINRPEAVEHFKTALSMTGSTDGPIFGRKEEGEKDKPETLEIGKGFLDDPGSMAPEDKQEISEAAQDTPPMPVPIAQETEQTSEDVLTPMPEVEGFVDLSDNENPDDNQVPRSPDEETQTNKAQTLLEQTMAARDEETSDALQETTQEESIQDDILPAEDSFGFDDSLGFEDNDSPQEAAETTQDKVDQDENKVITRIMPDKTDDASEEQQVQENPLEEQANKTASENTAAQEEIDSLKEEIEALKEKLLQQQKETRLARRQQEEEQVRQQTQSAQTSSQKPPAQRQASTAPVSGRWVLRAAQPGKAWVSRPGQRDMQSLVVGDTLSGIGRITDISFTNGRWVVQGTKGRINQ